MSASEEDLVGHAYTRARKHPLVVGKLPGAGRLPGGPYTITQIVTMVVTFGLLVMTQDLWAHFGVLNFLVLIALPWSLAWVLRYARMDGRDPARALRSLFTYTASPAGGRLSGRPQRPARPRLAAGACTVHVRTPLAPGAAVAAAPAQSSVPDHRPEPAPAAEPAPSLQVVAVPAPRPAALAPSTPRRPARRLKPVPEPAGEPAPAAAPAGAGPGPGPSPRTQLQELLASLDGQRPTP